jgi:hypothetical protein
MAKSGCRLVCKPKSLITVHLLWTIKAQQHQQFNNRSSWYGCPPLTFLAHLFVAVAFVARVPVKKAGPAACNSTLGCNSALQVKLAFVGRCKNWPLCSSLQELAPVQQLPKATVWFRVAVVRLSYCFGALSARLLPLIDGIGTS